MLLSARRRRHFLLMVIVLMVIDYPLWSCLHYAIDKPGLIIISLLAVLCADHDDVIKWKHFPCYWPFVRGIHRSRVNSPHKGQWLGALMFSLICAWINGWANNREAGEACVELYCILISMYFLVYEAIKNLYLNLNLVIWDAISNIMTSLLCALSNPRISIISNFMAIYFNN